MNAEQRNALLEIMDDRYGKYSMVVVSQLPTEEWYASLGDNTLADDPRPIDAQRSPAVTEGIIDEKEEK